MMKIIRKYVVLLLVLATLAAVGVMAVSAVNPSYSGTCGSKLTWNLNTTSGELTISGSGAMTAYNSSSKKAPWREYAAYVKKVTVADTVTSIGAYAFYNCNQLTEITIGDGVTSVGGQAFSGCTSLKKVHISSPERWTQIKFSNSLANPCTMGAAPYVSGRPVTSVTWSSGTAIDNYAFYHCTWLEEIHISEGITSIGIESFNGCTGLTEISFPASLKTINMYAFNGCVNLEEIRFSEGLEIISTSAFFGCASLTSLELPASLTAIHMNAFMGCSSLASVTFTGGNLEVGTQSFVGCDAITEVHAPTLEDWLSIRFADEPANPCSIARSLYLGGELLTSLVIPGSVSAVNGYAFSGCDPIEEIYVSEGVTALGDKAFSGCGEVSRVTLPGSLTAIGESAFEDTLPDLILFEGSEEQWAALSLGAGNELLEEEIHIHDGHTFDCEAADSLYFKAPADCVTASTYYKSCVCGEAGTETFTVGDPLGHTGGKATCTQQAVCSRCSQSYGDLLPHTPNRAAADCTHDQSCTVCRTVLQAKLGHDYDVSVIPPSCEGNGYTLHVCARCDHTYQDRPTDPTGHTKGPNATCTLPQICLVCHEELAAPLGHEEKISETLPTCTLSGFRVVSCERCDHVETEVTQPLGHTEGPEATCTQPQSCTVCHTVLVPWLGHSYKAEVTKPTCTDRGYTTHACERCDVYYVDSYTDTVKHTPGAAATCTEPQTCTVCHSVLDEAKGHSYKETVTKPTCTERGFTTHTCRSCGDEYLDSFTETAPHTPGTAATCTEPQTCTVCATVLKAKLGHDYQRKITAATCTEQGFTTYTCGRCDHFFVSGYTALASHTPGAAATCTQPQSCTVCHAVLAPMNGHDYKDEVTAPTCTDRGFTTHTCADCGVYYVDSYTDVVDHTPGAQPTCTEPQTCTVCHSVLAPKINHSYKAKVTKPTCTERGFTTHTCANCEDFYVDTYTAVLPHTPGADATCTEPQVCTVCNGVVKEALGHDERTEVVAPTCEHRGYTVHTCSRCELEYADTYVKAKGHTPGPDATCTEAQSCTVCHAVLAPMNGHDYKDEVTAPTCTDRGFTTHTCADCGVYYVDSYTDVVDHTPGAEPTCTQPQTCTVCHAVLDDPTGHAFEEEITDPTCSQRGYTTHTCETCGESFIDSYTQTLPHTAGPAATCTEPQTCTVCHGVVKEALGHDERTETVAPTCVERGYTTHTCGRCDLEQVDRYTEAKGHLAGAAATCTTGQVCTRCDTLLEAARGHSYEDSTVEPTCTQPGYTAHSCTRCDSVLTDGFTEAAGHTPGSAATCTEHQTCTVCSALLAEKLEHDYTSETVAATCTEPGYTRRTCRLCGASHTDSLTVAPGHQPGEWITDKEPTAEEEGQRHTSCTVCGAVTRVEKLPRPEDTTEPGGNGSETREPDAETGGSPAPDGTGTSAPNKDLADELLGNPTGCKKAQNILIYIVIGLVMIIAAIIFWRIDNRRKDS